MKRWGLLIGLLLSLGVNLGLVASHWIQSHVVHTPVEGPSIDSPSIDSPGLDSPGLDEPATDDPSSGVTAAPTEQARDRIAPPVERRLRRLVGRMATRLRLEGDERRRFVETQMGFFRRSAQARRESRELERRLRAELMAPAPDRARAEDLLAQLGSRQVELEAAFIDTYFDTLPALEPAQQAEYRRILGQLRSMRRAMDRRLGDGEPRRRWMRDRPRREEDPARDQRDDLPDDRQVR